MDSARRNIDLMSPKPRVLVVEDDGEIAEVLRRSLRLEGYEVRLYEGNVLVARQTFVRLAPKATV